MRRLLIFAALLSLLGLSTAFAASFTVQSEDIASFTTDVSISIPTVPFPATIYVRGAENDPLGDLLLNEPKDNVPTTNRNIRRDTEAVQEQLDPLAFYTWSTPASETTTYRLEGTVTLVITQNQEKTDRLTAGLLECEEAAAPDSSDVEQCELLATAVADEATETGNGYKDRTVRFGSIGPFIVEPGHQLRLKIVNQSASSSSDFSISWGYNSARTTLLTIT